jgi:hypothetical protein
MDVVLLMLDGDHSRHRFYYSGKHKSCRLIVSGHKFTK